MKLHVLGSSSSGNCYILQDESEALIIEAGIPLASVKEALNFQTTKVSGVLVSHLHGDHAKYIKPFSSIFEVYTLQSVLSKYNALGTPIEAEKTYKIGNFNVYPITSYHDVPCLGFFIKHSKTGNIFFATDTAYTDYRLKNVNHFLIECNYNEDALNLAINEGRTNLFMKDRLINTHMSLNTAIETVLDHDLSDVRNIILIHLSSNNSNEKEIIKEFESKTGKIVRIAKKGEVFNFGNSPY